MSAPTFVFGLGRSGTAVARFLRRAGGLVILGDDNPSPAAADLATELGAELVIAPTGDDLTAVLRRVERVVPAPGVPASHPVFAAAASNGVTVLSEFDLAAEHDLRPRLLVTGTNGKTSVTTLATEMLIASGVDAVAAGNIGLPLVEALAGEAECFVVEASSFTLERSGSLPAAAALWLNFASDHLDAHGSLDAYREAKGQVFRGLPSADGIAIVPFGDDVITSFVPPGVDITTFGPGGDFHCDGDELVGPEGRIAAVADFGRALPHDLVNAAAAAAIATVGGATREGIAAALKTSKGLAHRVELVGTIGGVDCFNDSKATTPSAALAAIRSFDRAVLIAGGRNKGVALDDLAAAPERLVGAVAIGDAAGEVAAVLEPVCAVARAASMDEAVDRALAFATSVGDVVLLSPGCASFDWYGSYTERGDDFARAVRARQHAREEART